MDITEPLKQTANDFEERLQPLIEESTEKLTSLHHQLTTYIRANPGKCLLGAMAAGYFIGRIARRK